MWIQNVNNEVFAHEFANKIGGSPFYTDYYRGMARIQGLNDARFHYSE